MPDLFYRTKDEQDYIKVLTHLIKHKFYFHGDEDLSPGYCWKAYKHCPVLCVTPAKRYICGYVNVPKLNVCKTPNDLFKKLGISGNYNFVADKSL